MTLHLIGIGLADQKDITVKGLEIVKKCNEVYIENYTSLLQCSLQDLAKYYGKEITIADRRTTEQGDERIIEQARQEDVAFLVIGDPLSATTHIQLYKLAKEKGVEVQVIGNASVLTAIGITGLELYKFGKVTSIPFIKDHPNLETPYNVIKENGDLHTLCLLDIQPPKFMTVSEALGIIFNIENKKKENVISEDTLVIGCARLGTADFVVKSGPLKEIREFDFGAPPHCIIIPGQMHFVEKEMVDSYANGL